MIQYHFLLNLIKNLYKFHYLNYLVKRNCLRKSTNLLFNDDGETEKEFILSKQKK